MNVNHIAKKNIAKTIKKKNVNKRKVSTTKKRKIYVFFCPEDIGFEYENNMICFMVQCI